MDLKTADGVCDIYVTGQKTDPGILLLMDIFGPRPWLNSMADKIAAQGYYVAVPNLFYRLKRAPFCNPEDPVDERRKVCGELYSKFNSDVFVERDVPSLIEIFKGPIGVVGYCMGGGLAIRTAAAAPERVVAAASFHGGRLQTDAPNSPHLFVGSIRGELYLGHAWQDATIPAEQIAAFEQTLRAAGVKFKSEMYKAAHGWTQKDLPPWNEEATEKHWQALFAFFSSTLK